MEIHFFRGKLSIIKFYMFIHNITIATQECWRVIMNGGCSSYSFTDVSIM